MNQVNMFCAQCGKEAVETSSFCDSCGKLHGGEGAQVAASPIVEVVPARSKKWAWICLLGPGATFVGLIVLWGVINMLSAGSDSEVFLFINNMVTPILFALTFLAFPVGIIVAIILFNQK